jgi:PKHD-type hydroxylase
MTLSFEPKLNSHITHPYVYWDGWFTEEELKTIETYCVDKGTERAKVVNENGVAYESNIRPCNTAFHFPTDDTQWFFEKLAALIELVNNKYYQYDIWGFEGFQYTEYDGNGDRYGYHIDMITGSNVPEYLRMPRKLSVSLLLNNKEDYKGGDFAFNVSEENILQPEQKRGRVLIFPSFMLHKVDPVVDGCRKSIVTWIVGPKFR